MSSDTENDSLVLWGDGHFLTLGGDGSKRVWNGEFHLVAFYDRALNPAEVKKNFDAGVH